MSIQIKQKTLRRAEWARIRHSAFAWADFQRGPLRGVAGLLRLSQVRQPLVVASCGMQTVIADSGFDWLQIAPQGENWWLTVMFDANGAIRQYYFDITRRNHLAGADSFFEDLLLDVVAALAAGVITAAEAAAARATAGRLLAEIPSAIGQLEAFCHQLHRKLSPALA